MKYSPILLVHICTAILGILSGPVALISRKGSRLHRWSGNVFFISMLSMSASAVFIAAFMSPNVGNVMVGVLTFYLVATAWATVKRKERRIGLFEFGAMLVVLADAAAFLHFGREAANSATGVKDGIPATVYFVVGSVAFLAAALDIRNVDQWQRFRRTSNRAASLAHVLCAVDCRDFFFPRKAATLS